MCQFANPTVQSQEGDVLWGYLQPVSPQSPELSRNAVQHVRTALLRVSLPSHQRTRSLTNLVEQPPKVILHLLSAACVLTTELPVLRHER